MGDFRQAGSAFFSLPDAINYYGNGMGVLSSSPWAEERPPLRAVIAFLLAFSGGCVLPHAALRLLEARLSAICRNVRIERADSVGWCICGKDV